MLRYGDDVVFFLVRLIGGSQAMRMHAPRVGGSFAVWCGLFSAFDCTMVCVRQTEDPWNSITAGAATGGFLQMRTDVSVEVDKLADSISNGVKVAEVQITTLIEMLMRQTIKLDNISAEGIRTRSQADILNDGYRWRGQKAVKKLFF